jgi:glycosyltransferase involved in cell wall biosynthesis
VPRRIVVLTRDRTGPELGGNAVRAAELARVLAAHGDVTLTSPGEAPDGPFEHIPWEPERPRGLRGVLADADVVVATPQSPAAAAELRRCGAKLILDAYDPFPLAVLEGHRDGSRLLRRVHVTLARDAYLGGLRSAHHVICASERQRDLWLGAMLAAGLLKPDIYDADPTLRSRIDVVPTGVSAEPLPPGTPLRDGLGLGDGDEIVLWYGGLWNWLDPVTPVLAMPALLERRPAARLVYLGRSPAAETERAEADRARAAARELGPASERVHFLETTVPYSERGAWLREAACAVSTHDDHLETRFAFRTRILDFVWARLPVVCTAGDTLSELVDRDGLGATVPPRDPAALAEALTGVLATGREGFAPRFERAAGELSWPRAAAPLVRLVTDPERPPRLGDHASAAAVPGPPVRALATRALQAARRGVTR